MATADPHGPPGPEDRAAAELVLAAAQPACRALDVEANARAHADLVRAARARVVIFPELSLTGYELDAPAVAMDDPRLRPLIEACAETGTVAVASAPVEERFLALLAVDGAGARVAYRKMNLAGHEPGHFRPGPAPAVLEVDGWRLGLALCKDTGVPAHQEQTAALGIDAYVAGALDRAEDAVVHEQRARRISTEHGVWVAIASFAGPTGDGYVDNAGRSGIWSPDGELVTRAGAEPGDFVRATLRR
ncbi:carbon-nitrogen hydrolase family protein [Symbioplanes lichenis]|uniref:carbon-nitrogen hydrolase family protein n=1 Tax=Symbioplanes lichenis TaxID=1629072 RepID=UPI00273A32B5|nr:carbon-nitrogen hydrolase family protein [Actinoplanes lichenis]